MTSTREVTVRAHQIGAELRHLRTLSGLTLIEAASRIDVSHSKLSRLEQGKIRPQRDDIVALLAIYRVTGQQRGDLLALTEEAQRCGWWQKSNEALYQRIHTLRTLETSAVSITNYEPEFVPGLLQTVPYMQAMMRETEKLTDEDMVDRVAARIGRQQVFRRQRQPEFVAIISESVLHQGIGGPEVMGDQLAYLLEAAAKRHITIRVVPNSIGGHEGLAGPFVRLRFAERPDVVMEATRTSDIFLEDPRDMAYYDRVETDVLAAALEEDLSIKLIAGAARDRDQEASWHDRS